ncbi:hypothetical protein RHMOL_Rhmol08G0138500 [Rhododendron molle]|uniref:Uncharacterized protein n=1 Tax=Rhododendron molle TaxID=49168 RepID=A0ACC0MN38_RHOML|nr:hypothetical protein RHMOL_Rhmol08G0138500 [Rhododendron molle]
MTYIYQACSNSVSVSCSWGCVAEYTTGGTGTKLSHTYCNANQCADHLAHLGAKQNDELIIAVTTPISLREFLIKDSLLLRQTLD